MYNFLTDIASSIVDRGSTIWVSSMYTTKLVRVSTKVVGVEGKITDLFDWDTVIGENFIKTEITVP